MKNKLKKFWDDNAGYVIGGAFIAGGITLAVVAFRSMKKGSSWGLPTVINEGSKKTYQMGGPDSPFKYELTDEIAAAYNRVGEIIAKAKTPLILADDKDMAAWNYVAAMSNAFIAKSEPIANELVTDHFLRLI